MLNISRDWVKPALDDGVSVCYHQGREGAVLLTTTMFASADAPYHGDFAVVEFYFGRVPEKPAMFEMVFTPRFKNSLVERCVVHNYHFSTINRERCLIHSSPPSADSAGT